MPRKSFIASAIYFVTKATDFLEKDKTRMPSHKTCPCSIHGILAKGEGRLSTGDLLAPTYLEQLLCIKFLFTF
jgi:hypothetical protein